MTRQSTFNLQVDEPSFFFLTHGFPSFRAFLIEKLLISSDTKYPFFFILPLINHIQVTVTKLKAVHFFHYTNSSISCDWSLRRINYVFKGYVDLLDLIEQLLRKHFLLQLFTLLLEDCKSSVCHLLFEFPCAVNINQFLK